MNIKQILKQNFYYITIILYDKRYHKQSQETYYKLGKDICNKYNQQRISIKKV